jgi:hypothetical protein
LSLSIGVKLCKKRLIINIQNYPDRNVSTGVIGTNIIRIVPRRKRSIDAKNEFLANWMLGKKGVISFYTSWKCISHCLVIYVSCVPKGPFLLAKKIWCTFDSQPHAEISLLVNCRNSVAGAGNISWPPLIKGWRRSLDTKFDSPRKRLWH